MKIALISCTKLKQDYSCKAEEMYMKSTLFKKATSYIKQQKYNRWFILSAKYGLLIPDEIIEPYNKTLNNMKAQEIKSWAENVFLELNKYKIKQIDFYVGEKYRKYLIPILIKHNISYSIPLKGLGIGQQLQFYTKEVVN